VSLTDRQTNTQYTGVTDR